MLNNSKGFSLVGVMVGFALLGGLALGVMKMSDQIGFLENKASGGLESKELLTEIRLILDDPNHCRMSLAGPDPVGSPVTFRKINVDEPSRPTEGLPVEIWLSNRAGTARLTKKFSWRNNDPTNRYGKIYIDDIRLFMKEAPGANYPNNPNHSDLGIVRVKYSYKLGKGKSRGLFKDFLINVKMSSSGGLSTIQSCTRQSDAPVPVVKNVRAQNCSWTPYVNNWDGDINYDCGGDKVMAGVASYHDNHHEDRRFKYYCCDLVDQDGDTLTRVFKHESFYVNGWDGDVNYTCPTNTAMVATSSYHNNGNEDRRFSFFCASYGSNVAWKTTYMSGFVNAWDGGASFTCPSAGVLCGEYSYHDNGKEDRRFRHRCCRLELTELP